MPQPFKREKTITYLNKIPVSVTYKDYTKALLSEEILVRTDIVDITKLDEDGKKNILNCNNYG